MPKIHYFQRYSSKENTVTNNTLLLFSRLYHHDSRVFKEFLNQLHNDKQNMAIISTIEFVQQTSANNSVQDGAITHESFTIVIEIKIYGHENIEMIILHNIRF